MSIKGYDLSLAGEDENPLTPAQYLEEMNRTFKVNGPTGMIYVIRRPEPETMRLMIMSASGSNLTSDKDNMLLMDDVSDQYLPGIILEPKIVKTPEHIKAKIDAGRDISKEPRDKDVIWLCDLAYQDRLAILTWALASTEVLPLPSEVATDKSFPDESGSGTDGPSG